MTKSGVTLEIVKLITNFLITNYEFQCDLTYFHDNTHENDLCELSVLMWLKKKQLHLQTSWGQQFRDFLSQFLSKNEKS